MYKMRKILIVGAGRSSAALVRYLLDRSTQENLKIVIADISVDHARKLAGNHVNSEIVELDIFNTIARKKLVESASIVISMLPARFHFKIAKDCLEFDKNLVTASYISKELMYEKIRTLRSIPYIFSS